METQKGKYAMNGFLASSVWRLLGIQVADMSHLAFEVVLRIKQLEDKGY